MKAYRIKDSDNFETTETKRLRSLSWVPLPNRHDGKGYRRLMRRPRGHELYSAWIGLLTVASKCKPRWVLADKDGPLSAQDLSDKTDIPVECFSLAFDALLSKEIGWIEEIEIEELTDEESNLREHAGVCGDLRERPLEGKEGKGKKERKLGGTDEPSAPTVNRNRSTQNEHTAGADALDAPTVPKGRKPKPQRSEAEIIEDFAADPTYEHVDVRFEFGKMLRWCRKSGKKPTELRFVNWLNRIEKPLGGCGPFPDGTLTDEERLTQELKKRGPIL